MKNYSFAIETLIAIMLFASIPSALTVESCMDITEPGSYHMEGDIVNTGPQCFKITASNTIVDCRGFSITNQGLGYHGIKLAPVDFLTNVTVRNCNVSGFLIGIDIANIRNSLIEKNTLHDNSRYGINAVFMQDTVLQNNTVIYNTLDGMLISQSTGNLFARNTIHHNRYGIRITGDNNIYAENQAYSNTHGGIYIESSNFNTIYKNTLYSNGINGLYITTGSENNVTENTAYSNGNYGLKIGQGNGNYFTYNSAYGQQSGILVENFQNGKLLHNIAFGNTVTGISLSSSSGNNLTNNTLYENPVSLSVSAGSNFNKLHKNLLFNNSNKGISVTNSNENSISKNTLNNSATAIYLSEGGQNVIYNNYVNSGPDIQQEGQQNEPPAPQQNQTPSLPSQSQPVGGLQPSQAPLQPVSIQPALQPLSNEQIQQATSNQCQQGELFVEGDCVPIGGLGVCEGEIHRKTAGVCCSEKWIPVAAACPNTGASTVQVQQQKAGVNDDLLPVVGIAIAIALFAIGGAFYLFSLHKPDKSKGENISMENINKAKTLALLGFAFLALSVVSLNSGPLSQTFYSIFHLSAAQNLNGIYLTSSSGNNLTLNIVGNSQQAFTLTASSTNILNSNQACKNINNGYVFANGATGNTGNENKGSASGNLGGNPGFETSAC